MLSHPECCVVTCSSVFTEGGGDMGRNTPQPGQDVFRIRTLTLQSASNMVISEFSEHLDYDVRQRLKVDEVQRGVCVCVCL